MAIDVGLANGEPFLLMAGVGWDAAIALGVSRRLMRALGPAAYFVQGMRRLPRLRATKLRWHSGSLTVDAPIALLVASNTPLYGGLVRFSPKSTATDGLLDIAALSPRRRGDGATIALQLLRGRLEGDRRVFGGRVEELTIETAGVPYQLDGDPVGLTPLALAIVGRAMNVRVPGGRLAGALRAEPQDSDA